MKCAKCEAELTKDIKFCPYCGTPIEKEEDSILEEMEEKSEAIQKAMDTFTKIVLFSAVLVVLLLIIAICIGSLLPILISILQLVGILIALLLHKGKIKCGANWVKYTVLIIALALTVANLTSYSWQDSVATGVSALNKVAVPYGATDCVGKDKDTVKKDFEEAGFTNVKVEALEDLELADIEKSGLVASVSISGDGDFAKNSTYRGFSKVVIRYHSFKSVPMSFSSEEAKAMDGDAIIKAMEKVGFFNIVTEEVFDLDPDTTEAEFENQVVVNGISSFQKNDKFPMDAEVKIITHRPYAKYTLKIMVDFNSNIIFNRYDVKFTIGEETESLSHGQDGEFEYRLKEGEYTLTFQKKELSSVKGTVTINLTGDTEAFYSITCEAESITVKTVYVENYGAVGENDAMVPYSSSNCKYKNYRDIEDAFLAAGFTNVSTQAVYDIFWGITPEGSVEKVAINGETGFVRGDIFAKDAEVVIVYHLRIEDDPALQEGTESEGTEAGGTEVEGTESGSTETDGTEIDTEVEIL